MFTRRWYPSNSPKCFAPHPAAHRMVIGCRKCNTNAYLFSDEIDKIRELKCTKCSALLCVPVHIVQRTEKRYGISRWDFKEILRRQFEEIEVLQSIYLEHEFYLQNPMDDLKPPFIGCLKLPVTLSGERFTVHYHQHNDVNELVSSESRTVKYLPTVDLYFLFTEAYPKYAMPRIVIRCVWLPDKMLLQLYRKLTELWNTRRGTEVIFTWGSFIKHDLVKYFQLKDEIAIFTSVQSDSYEGKAPAPHPTFVGGGGGGGGGGSEDVGMDPSMQDAIIIQANPVCYTKYSKYDDVASTHCNSSATNLTATMKSSGVCSDERQCLLSEENKKRKPKKTKNRKAALKTADYVNLNGRTQLVYKGGMCGAAFKYETEKETKERLKNDVVLLDGDTKQYAITADSILDLSAAATTNHPPSQQQQQQSTGTAGRDVGSDGKRSKQNRIYAKEAEKNENKIYDWLRFRSGIRLCQGADCTYNHVVTQNKLRTGTKIHLIEEANRVQFERTGHDCAVCYENKPGRHCVMIVACCHVVCNDCIRDYVQTCVSSGTVRDGIKCLQVECDVKVRECQLKELLSENLFEQYKDQKFKFAVESNQKLTYCPRKGCGNVAFILDYDDEERIMGHCRQCQFYFCVYCRKAHHGRQYCLMKADERKKILDEYVNASSSIKKIFEQQYSKKQLNEWVNDNLSQQWIDEKGKSCPKCKAIIEKYSGCNKVVCVKCGTAFCWMCLEILKSKDPYDHYNDRSSPCYNKLFLGVNVDEEDFELLDGEDEDDEMLEMDDVMELLMDDELLEYLHDVDFYYGEGENDYFD